MQRSGNFSYAQKGIKKLNFGRSETGECARLLHYNCYLYPTYIWQLVLSLETMKKANLVYIQSINEQL